MTNPTGYWCPMCGELPTTPMMGIAILALHKADCIGFHAVPVYRPLDVPEVTTWGESGGAEAVTLHVNSITPWWMLGDDSRRAVDFFADKYWMGSGRGITAGDVVEAMNFLAGAK